MEIPLVINYNQIMLSIMEIRSLLEENKKIAVSKCISLYEEINDSCFYNRSSM